MIYQLARNKKLLRLIRSSFFLERLKLEVAVQALRYSVGFSYVYIHKVIGELLFGLANSGKSLKGVTKYVTPQLVATSLAYSIPLLLLI